MNKYYILFLIIFWFQAMAALRFRFACKFKCFFSYHSRSKPYLISRKKKIITSVTVKMTSNDDRSDSQKNHFNLKILNTIKNSWNHLGILAVYLKTLSERFFQIILKLLKIWLPFKLANQQNAPSKKIYSSSKPVELSSTLRRQVWSTVLTQPHHGMK